MGSTVPSLKRNRTAGQHPDPRLMTPITEQLEWIVTVCNKLLKDQVRPIPNVVCPLSDIFSPLLCHSAVIDDRSTFDSSAIHISIYAAVDELIDGKDMIRGCKRRFKLVEARGVTAVVIEEYTRLFSIERFLRKSLRARYCNWRCCNSSHWSQARHLLEKASAFHDVITSFCQ